MLLIGIAGPTASGKTSVARCIEKQFGGVRTRYSEILAEIAKERGLDTDKATLQNLYVTERELKGEGFLADLIRKKIESITADILVVEGNRRIVDIELLKQLTMTRDCELRLLYVDASPEERFQRYNARQERAGEEKISWEVFDALEKNPAEDELLKIRDIIQADGAVLVTDACSEEDMLKKALRALLLTH